MVMPHPGDGCGMDAMPLRITELKPVTMCMMSSNCFILIDSVDCAVDMLQVMPCANHQGDTIVRVGRYVSDVYKGRHDLVNILRPQSIAVAGGRLLVLSSSRDSSYLAVLSLDPRNDSLIPVATAGLPFRSQIVQATPCGRKVTVAGVNQSGYDIRILRSPEGIDNIAAAIPTSCHYHVPQQAERIQSSDPVGVGLTAVAVTVVFFALMCIALILKGYGSAIRKVQDKKAAKAKAQETGSAAPVESSAEGDTPGDVYAAIAAAIYLYDEELHDEEDNIITIQKVERAWTPWNAKYYNMNHYFNNKKR